MNTLPEITHESDQHPQLYAAQVKAATTLEELKAVIELWKPLCFDAWQVVQTMTPADFDEYQRGCALERQNIFAGEMWYQKYKAIQFPAVMFRVSMIAVENELNWGYAFLEMERRRYLTQIFDGIYQLKE